MKLRANSTRAEDGQALVEFALSLPILVFFIMGIIDFGMILFSYSHSSNSLRDALRAAEVIGYRNTTDLPPYLDCATMIDKASEDWFGVKQDIDITYVKTDGSGKTYDCMTVSPDKLADGDILRIHLLAKVDPLFLPIGPLKIEFDGERSLIVKEIQVVPIASGPGGGSDPSVITPPAPYNFRATENCTTGKVSFSWNWGTTSPLPTRAEIRDASDGTVKAHITNTSSTTCTDCDDISIPVGSRNYYIVAFNGSGSSEKVSAHSNEDSAVCTTDPPVPVPPAPTNFNATINCTTGTVSFSWNWGTTSPMPTRAQIRSFSDNAVRKEITDTSTTTCTDCDTIPVPGEWKYYIVAYNGSGAGEQVSPISSPVTVLCQAAAPPAPTNFTATCTAGKVSFGWNWGTTSPMPSRAEIRDANSSWKYAITNTTSTACTDCDAISAPGNRTYYIVAYNGTGASESVASAQSNTYEAVCTAPATGTLKVILRNEGNKNQHCNFSSGARVGYTVSVDGGVGSAETVLEGTNGTATFTNVLPGNYTITIPAEFPVSNGQSYKPNSVTDTDNNPCRVISTTTTSYTDTNTTSLTTVAAGATTTVVFGYAQQN